MAATVEIVIKAVDQMSQVLDQVRQKTKNLREVGTTFQKVGLGLTAVGGAISAGIGMAVKTFEEFEYAMKNVQAVSGATGEELTILEEKAREMGASTVFSAKEAADAMYYLASAGMKTQDIVSSLNGVLQLAAATQSDLAFASQTITASLSQFGLSAEQAGRVADVFASAISNSQATLEKLANSMRYVGPVANSLGMSLEETTATLMALYNAGYRGEQAGTILRGAFSALLSPSKSVREAINSLGLELQDLNPTVHSVAEIIDTLAKAGADTADVIQIFGREAGPGVAALIQQGGDAIRKYTSALKSAGGTAQNVAETQMDSLHGQLKILRSAFQEMQIAIGEAVLPTISAFVEKITSLINWFNQLPEPIKNAITNMTMWGSAILTVSGGASLLIGTIMKMIATFKEFGSMLSLLTGNVSKLSGVFTLLKTVSLSAAKGIGSALSFLATNPQWLLLAATIAGIIIIIKAIIEHWDEVVAFFKKTLKVIVNIFSAAWNAIKKVALFVVDLIVQDWKNFVREWQRIWEAIKKVAEIIWNFLKEIAIAVADYITKRWKAFVEFWKSAWNVIKSIAEYVWKGIKLVAEAVITFLTARWTAFAKFWQATWDVIKKVAGAVWNFLKAIAEAVAMFITERWKAFAEFWKKLWEGIQRVATAIWNAIKKAGEAVVNALKSIWEGFANFWKKLWDGLKNFVLKIWDGIKGAAKKVSDSLVGHSIIPDMIDQIIKEFKRLSEAENMIENIEDRFDNLSKIKLGGMQLGTAGAQRVSNRVNVAVNVREPSELTDVLRNIMRGVMT